MAKSGLTITVDRVAGITEALHALGSQRVMVGIPSTKNARNDGPISNSELGYIHENGAPEANIPPRPFLVPGVKSIQQKVIAELKEAGALALDGKSEAVTRKLNALGSMGASAVQKKITDGPFDPLKPSTVRNRMSKHKGRKDSNPRPLIDTGQLRRAITWVVRKVTK